MPKFRGPVVIYAYLTVEGDDMYDADKRAQSFDKETLASMINWDEAEYEVFDDHWPEEV